MGAVPEQKQSDKNAKRKTRFSTDIF